MKIPYTFEVVESRPGSITHEDGRVEVRRTKEFGPRNSHTDVWALDRAEIQALYWALGEHMRTWPSDGHMRAAEAMRALRDTTPRMPVDLDDPEYHTPPSRPLPPSRSVCDARARIGTGEGSCGRLLDRYGQCDRAGDHL